MLGYQFGVLIEHLGEHMPGTNQRVSLRNFKFVNRYLFLDDFHFLSRIFLSPAFFKSQHFSKKYIQLFVKYYVKPNLKDTFETINRLVVATSGLQTIYNLKKNTMSALQEGNEWREDSENRGSLQERSSPEELFKNVFAAELPAFAGVIRTAFEMAMTDLSRYPPFYQLPSTKAHETARFIKGLLVEQFPDLIQTKGSRYYLQREGHRFYFKKLTSSLMPMNNPTRTSRGILGQLPIFPGFENFRVVEVFIGYRLNKAKDEVDGCFAVYIAQNTVQWKIPIDNLPGVLPIGFTTSPQSSDLDNDALIVKPKRKRKDDQTGS